MLGLLAGLAERLVGGPLGEHEGAADPLHLDLCGDGDRYLLRRGRRLRGDRRRLDHGLHGRLRDGGRDGRACGGQLLAGLLELGAQRVVRGDQPVQRGQRPDAGDRHQVTAAEPADLPFHPALLVRALFTRDAEERGRTRNGCAAR